MVMTWFKDGGGGDVRHERDADADERGGGGEAFGAEERLEEGVLIFAVAILVGEDLGGGVRLEAADAEVDADVAGLGGDEVVDGADLVLGRGDAFGEVVGAGAEGVGGGGAGCGEGAVPVADLGPAMEGGPGYGGKRATVGAGVRVFGRVGLVGVVACGPGRGQELGDVPGIGASGGLVGDGGLVVGAPDLDVFVFGDLEGEDLGEGDDGAGRDEVGRSPELAGGLGLVDDGIELVVERVGRRRGSGWGRASP